MGKIIFVCGLIGAGKTTYAINQNMPLTDLDFMPKYSRKIDQINLSKRMLKTHNEIIHITCFPTEEELNQFKDYERSFIWIDTSFEQAKTNILIRNRERDLQNIGSVLQANKKYSQMFINSTIRFDIIKLFR